MNRRIGSVLGVLALMGGAQAGGAGAPLPGVSGLSGAWQVVAWTLPGAPLVPTARPTLTFADGQVTGTGGCNRYFAPLTQSGDRLSVGTVRTTRIFCDGPVNPQESAFVAALSGQRLKVTRQGAALRLTTPSGATLTLRPVASQPAP